MSFKRGNNENDEISQGPPAKVQALDEDEFLLEDVDEQMAEEMLIDIANQFEDSLETSQDEGFEDNVPEEFSRDILEDDLALEDSDDDESDEEVENVQEVEENPDEESESDSDDNVDFSDDSLESSSESDEDESSEGSLKKYTRRWIKDKVRNDSKHAITVMDMNYPNDEGMPATVRLLNFGMILFQTEQGFVRPTWKGRFVLDEEHEQMRYSVRPFQISLITLTQITDAKLYMDFWCWNDQRSMRLIGHNDRTCRWLRRFLEDLETFRRIGNFTMFLGPSDERVINESYQTANRSVPEFYGNVDGAQAKDVAFPFHSKTMFKAVRLLSELYPER